MINAASTRWIALFLIYPAMVILVLGLGAVVFVAHAYRVNKIDILTNRNLQPVLDKAGNDRAPVTVYLVGDSQIAHWPLDCRYDWLLYRSGFPGEATSNIVSATQSLLSIARPDVVFVISGSNDLTAASLLPEQLQQSAIATSISSFRTLIEQGLESGAREILISRAETTRYNLAFRWLLQARNIDKLRNQWNSGLDEVCQNHCRLVSLKELLRVKSNSEWKTYLSDKVHLNNEAYRVLAKSLDAIIRS